ncbi:MAG: glycosyltransferase [Peptococcaceae bacterium]|nr:glycosyltransferase [Peptococcaceae bacterium]
MNEQEKAVLKDKIDKATLISFDIFDTLLFRKTNTPETVFDLIGKHFGIHGFRKLRMDEQNEASRRAYAAHQHPHADMNDIYEVLSEHTEIPVNWEEVKAFEIQMERDALIANQEMLEIFRYVKEQGKRVVATSDMYLPARILSEYLVENGFDGFDYVYCSADEHKAKFNRELFELVSQKEQVPYENILHIGDKERDDGEYPASYGIDTFVYHHDANLSKLKPAAGSDVDKGLYKILYDDTKGFWYNLGLEVGGPLYMGLYRYLRQKLEEKDKKIYFLSRDGYNLYHLFKNQGYDNIEYLYVSRRALTLAAITDMNERDIMSLPPYTCGQTVGEILDYLCIERQKILHLHEAGFQSFEDVIRTEEDRSAFKQLYVLDKDVFLERAKVERENAIHYFNSIGFFDEDAICFDCGWQGSSQELLEQFKKACGYETSHYFIYFGIKNGDKSRKQLRGLHYETYLFDFYKNHALQYDLHQNVVLYELFFSAPHESVYYYDSDGKPVFETGNGDSEKADMLNGILDFLNAGLEFVDRYDVEYTPELAVGHLKRLIHMPTEEEAVKIGNLQNVDGFARKQDETKYIAYLTAKQLEENPDIELYWPTGLLARPDVEEAVKKACAARYGITWPAVIPEYHLEDPRSIRSYQRWMRNQKKGTAAIAELSYLPFFSVVIPVYNTVTEQLEACIESVLAQNYDNYELILVDDHSSWENVVPVLQKYETESHVQVIYRSTNGHISVATNDGIAASNGDFIVFMDCDDTIEPDALFEFARKLNENPELDFIYSDEDKITEDSKIRHMPFFKPDWSPDTFMNMMYTNHLATYRASIVKAIGGLRTAYNGSQDYDFTLRFMEQSDNKRVGHVAKVLYHWRERRESVAFAMTSKNYAAEAARHAKEDYIRRNEINARLEYIDGMSQYRTVYGVTGSPVVSVVIPSKDHPDVLKQCIDSIIEYTDYQNYEIIVVDNGSSDVNREQITSYLEKTEAVYVYEKADFNFSHMCNLGAAHAKGEYLLFLNDDMEIFQPDWLERMLGHAQQKHTGAVGAKLLYPQTAVIQHVGVSNPVNGPLHSFMTCDDRVPYYFGWNWIDCNCIAVTGACLMVAANKFREVNGFDEQLPVAYNDVKLCFALHEKGYYNVMRNDVTLYHHESLSRGSDQIDDRKLMRMNRERARLFGEFASLRDNDPYMSDYLRGYAVGLNLKADYDRLIPVDLQDCEQGNGSIDRITAGENIQIIGWSVLEGEDHPEELERYIVFQDPYGRTFAASTLPMARADVAAHFGNSGWLYAGLEAVVRKAELRIDLMQYRTGVLTIGRDGRRYLCWSRTTDLQRNSKPRPIAMPVKQLDSFTLCESAADVQWYLDTCQREDGYYLIRGFAYRRSGTHQDYRKSLILRDSAGNTYELDVQQDERLDVAYTFVEEHFLYYTGFVCYVYDGMLPAGQSYDVIIQLKNMFDETDLRHIVTEGRITTDIEV